MFFLVRHFAPHRREVHSRSALVSHLRSRACCRVMKTRTRRNVLVRIWFSVTFREMRLNLRLSTSVRAHRRAKPGIGVTESVGEPKVSRPRIIALRPEGDGECASRPAALTALSRWHPITDGRLAVRTVSCGTDHVSRGMTPPALRSNWVQSLKV